MRPSSARPDGLRGGQRPGRVRLRLHGDRRSRLERARGARDGRCAREAWTGAGGAGDAAVRGGPEEDVPDALDRHVAPRWTERRQRLRELRHAREAARRVLLEAALYDRVELRRYLRPQRGEGRMLGLQDGGDELRHGLRHERRAPAQELVDDHADRPDVRPRVDRSRRRHLLRRHVERGAHDGGRLRELRLARVEHRLRDAEIEHLDDRRAVRALGEEEVCGLEIPVNDAERVRLGDRLAGL